ncbi:hypothetical protein Tco_0529720 [Tanacetum coccineum]
MNDLERNSITLPLVTVNTKFLNCLQPEWLKHVTQVHLAKRLTEDTYNDLFDYLQQFEKLVNASRAKKLEKSQDPLALVAHTNPLPSAMILLARVITQRFSNPTNNRLRTSSNTINQAIVQADRVNIQSRNSGNDGRNTRRSYVQEEIIEGNNIQNDAGNIQRTLRTTSSGFAVNMLLEKQDEAGVTLTNEQNDFLVADATWMEEIEELSANICLVARIQPAKIDFDAGPSYYYAFLSEESRSTSDLRPTIAEYQSSWWIDNNLYFQEFVPRAPPIKEHHGLFETYLSKLEKARKRRKTCFKVSSIGGTTDNSFRKKWLNDLVIMELNFCLFKLETIIQVLSHERSNRQANLKFTDEFSSMTSDLCGSLNSMFADLIEPADPDEDIGQDYLREEELGLCLEGEEKMRSPAKRIQLCSSSEKIQPKDTSRVLQSMDTVWLSDDIEHFLGQSGQIKCKFPWNYDYIVDRNFWLKLVCLDPARKDCLTEELLLQKGMPLFYANGERYTTTWSEVDQALFTGPVEGNAVARRVIDDLVDISGETSVDGYMRFFKAQQVAETRLFVNRMREEAQTSRNMIGQLTALVAEMEAFDDPGEVFDTLMGLRDDIRVEEAKLAGLNDLITQAEEEIEMKEAQLEVMGGYVNGSVHCVSSFTRDKDVFQQCLNHIISEIDEPKWALFYCKPNKSLEKGLKLLHTYNDVHSFIDVAEEDDAGLRCSSSTPFSTRVKTKISKRKKTSVIHDGGNDRKKSLVTGGRKGKEKVIEDAGICRREIRLMLTVVLVMRRDGDSGYKKAIEAEIMEGKSVKVESE